MLKLPYLGFYKPDRITNQSHTTLLHSPESRVFRLKQVGKHVSQYECQKQSDQTQTINPNKTTYSFMQKITFRRDKSEEILEKAIHINNRHYPKSKSSNKSIFKTIPSLQSKHIDKQNSLMNIQRTIKEGHPMRNSKSSFTQIQTKLHKFKHSRPFRSQWFHQQKQTSL